MKRKVVPGGDMRFKDDVQIIDIEIAAPLSLPEPLPIISSDELQIFYKGNIFATTANVDPAAYIKVYKRTFGLEAIETPGEQENNYFGINSESIDNLMDSFIERAVNAIYLPGNGDEGLLGPEIGAELIEKITQKYSSLIPSGSYAIPPSPSSTLVTSVNDGSVFNTYTQEHERSLLVDNKLYKLLTIPEYVALFERHFDPTFLADLHKHLPTGTPEKISEILSDNKHNVHRKVLASVRNKIWHSERSFKLFLDNTYWIPFIDGEANEFAKLYKKLLERKVKIDAAKKYT